MILRYLWPAILWSVVVLILTLLPGEKLPDVPIFGIDKIVHFFIFGLLMILSAFGLYKISRQENSIQSPVLISLLYSVLFGIMIEVIQQYVPNRSFSVYDIIANVIGVGLGYLTFNIWRKRYGNSPSTKNQRPET